MFHRFVYIFLNCCTVIYLYAIKVVFSVVKYLCCNSFSGAP